MVAIHERNREGFRERISISIAKRCRHALRGGDARVALVISPCGGLAKRALQVLHGLGADAIERCSRGCRREQGAALGRAMRGKTTFHSFHREGSTG